MLWMKMSCIKRVLAAVYIDPLTFYVHVPKKIPMKNPVNLREKTGKLSWKNLQDTTI